MMLTQFRIRYPQGSVISELVTIDHGKYIVRVLVQVGTVTLGTGLARADTIEEAEDCARNRALELLNLDTISLDSPNPKESPVQEIPTPINKTTTVTISEPLLPDTNEQTSVKVPQTSVVAQSAPTYKKMPKTPKVEQKTEETPVFPEESLPLSSPQPLSPSTTPETISEPFEEVASPRSPITPTPLSTPETATVPTSTTTTSQEVPEISSSEEQLPLTSVEEPLDFSEIIASSDAEMKRLGWTKVQGRDYLVQTYGKRSRQVLSDEELIEFLHYLESLPTPS